MRKKRNRFRPSITFDSLENRCLLATISVTGLTDVVDAGDSELTLREAILLANSNGEDDVIELPEGILQLSIEGIEEDAAQTGDLDILPDGGSSLTIRGTSPTTTAIDGLAIDRIFEVHPESRFSLEGVQVRNGSLRDYPMIDQRRGGLVASFHATFSADNVSFLGGNAGPGGSGGAIFIAGGAYDFSESEFAFNEAFFAGSAIFARDSIGSIVLADVTDNATEANFQNDFRDGGAITIRSGELNISRSDFQRNTGGGMHAYWTTVSANHVRFRLTTGYAFSAHNVRITIGDSWFGQNDNGIKVTNPNSTLDLDEIRLRQNRSHAIEFFGETLTVDNSEILDNAGSGITGERPFEASFDNSITVRNSTFMDNWEGIDATTAVFHLENSAIDRNGDGNFHDERTRFGIRVKAFDASIVNSSITRNTSRTGSAAIQFVSRADDSELRIVNSLVADNSGFQIGNTGGAIYVGNSDETESPTARVSIYSSSFQDNQGGRAGVINAAGTTTEVTIKNSIIWFHASSDGRPYEGVSSFDVTDNLLIPRSADDIPSGGLGDPSFNNSSEDPMWVDWRRLDFHLLPDSPAIDHGNLDHLIADEFDLDGDGNTTEPNPDLDLNDRVIGLATDAGAYEFPTTAL